MVEAAERDGCLRPGSVLVESSSGNLGVALSMIAASKGYHFLCVTDSRCNLATRRLMEALGSQVHIVSEPDPVTGFLGARIDYVQSLCRSDDRYVWLNQYANPENWKAHFRTTAPAIARRFPDLDVLFVGAGTTGTLMGCARYFREWHRSVRIVAIDAVGSQAFGGPPARRMIPGLGTSVRPPLLDESYIDEVYASRRRTPSAPATGWREAGSCSAAPPARWSAVRWTGWLNYDAGNLTAVAIAPTWASAISTPFTSPTGCRTSTETTSSPLESTAPTPSAWSGGPRQSPSQLSSAPMVEDEGGAAATRSN